MRQQRKIHPDGSTGGLAGLPAKGNARPGTTNPEAILQQDTGCQYLIDCLANDILSMYHANLADQFDGNGANVLGSQGGHGAIAVKITTDTLVPANSLSNTDDHFTNHPAGNPASVSFMDAGRTNTIRPPGFTSLAAANK
jgi:hypothetical protein